MSAPLYVNKPVIKGDLSGKTILVMGANTGIGYEATKHFTAMNPKKVIITTRNEEKAAATVSRKGSLYGPLRLTTDYCLSLKIGLQS